MCLNLLPAAVRANEAIPRTIIALFNSKINPKSKFTLTHHFAEMPLNHLGLDVEYYDIQKPLPDLSQRADVRGILSWLAQGSTAPKPKEFLRWATENINRGLYYVIMGEPGFYEDREAAPTPTTLVQGFWQLFGIRDTLDWTEFTYDARIDRVDEEMIGFEYMPHGSVNPYYVFHPDSPDLRVLWSVNDPDYDRPIVLAALHPKGGFVADQYAVFRDEDANHPCASGSLILLNSSDVLFGQTEFRNRMPVRLPIAGYIIATSMAMVGIIIRSCNPITIQESRFYRQR